MVELVISTRTIVLDLEQPSVEWFEAKTQSDGSSKDDQTDPMRCEALTAMTKHTYGHRYFQQHQIGAEQVAAAWEEIVKSFKCMPNISAVHINEADAYIGAKEIRENFGHLSGNEFDMNPRFIFMKVLVSLDRAGRDIRSLVIEPPEKRWSPRFPNDPHPWDGLPIESTRREDWYKPASFMTHLAWTNLYTSNMKEKLPIENLTTLHLAMIPLGLDFNGPYDAMVFVTRRLLNEAPSLITLNLLTSVRLSKQHCPPISSLLPRQKPLKCLKKLYLLGFDDQETIKDTLAIYGALLSHLDLHFILSGNQGDPKEWYKVCEEWREHLKWSNLRKFELSIRSVAHNKIVRELAAFLCRGTSENPFRQTG